MLRLAYLLLVSSVLIAELGGAGASLTRDYLNAKRQEAKRVLAKSRTRAAETTGTRETVSWSRLWTETSRTGQPYATSLLGRTFLVDQQQLLLVSPAREATERFYVASELQLPSPQPVSFVKSFSNGASTFLLVCQIGSCTHYQGVDPLSLGNRQVIQAKQLVPLDALYFTRGNGLYLLISFGRDYDANTAFSVHIYRWAGSYMSLVEEIQTAGVNAMAVFQGELRTLLLFAIEQTETDAEQQIISCVVYELRDNHQSKVWKILTLNNMGSIVSIHPYSENGHDFALVISDEGLSGIFWWNGNDLTRWISLPEVKSSSLVTVVHLRNETLMFVCNSGELHIFRIANYDCVHVDDILFEDRLPVVEIIVWETEKSVMLLLIKLNLDGTNRIELYELKFQQQQFGIVTDDEVWVCFKQLADLLNSRMPIIENLRNSWPTLLPASENLTITSPLQLPDLIVDGASIGSLEFNDRGANISSPLDIINKLNKSEEAINEILTKAQQTVSRNKMDSFSGNITVDGDAYIDTLYIDNLNVEYLNGKKLDLENVLIPNADQVFSVPLQVKTGILEIDNLEVPSLCGIKFENWLQVNGTVNTDLASLNLSSAWIRDDTLFIDHDITLNDLNTKEINGVDMKDFLEDLFVIGERQTIDGNITYQDLVEVGYLFANRINGALASELLTKYTNQTLGDVYVETLEVRDLYVDKINGVPVDKAAKMSQENVIKGKVTLGDFKITDKMVVKEGVAFPYVEPTQVYDTIMIDGDIFVENLEFEDKATLALNESVIPASSIREIVDNSWSKSKNQTITSDITLEKGATIDELNCQYLNGLTERDFVYLTDESIDLENVTFANFHFNKVLNESSNVAESFYTETEDFLTFHRTVHLHYLSVDNVVTDSYNGVPVEVIMQANDSIRFPEYAEFETMHVEDRMDVEDIHINNINHRSLASFENTLMVNQNLYVDVLKADNLTLKNLHVENLNGKNLEEALTAFEALSDRSKKISLIVDGDLEVEGRLDVNTINDKDAIDYIDSLKNFDLVDLIETKNIKNLRIKENLNISSLNGQDVSDIFANALSKTSKQSLAGEFTVLNASITYLTTENINKKNVSNLLYIDEPITLYGNTSFDELIVHGNVKVKSLNGKSALTLRSDLHSIPIKKVGQVLVLGNVSWDTPSSNLHSLSYLLENAVTKHEDQVINGPVTFEESVQVHSLYVPENDSILQNVRDIIDDAVVDNSGGSILIEGAKIFQKEMTISDLKVAGNIDVETVNDLNIHEVAAQIFQKSDNASVSGEITFLGQVYIENLVTDKRIHGVPSYELATKGKRMPNKMLFEHLIVENVILNTLDGVEFDKFIKNRVTIDEDHEIYSEVEFMNPVTVLNGSFVSTINGIKPTNLVGNAASSVPIVIHGQKTFMSNLTVEGDVETSMINNINISAVYKNSVQNDENVNIFGNLIFEAGVNCAGNVIVSGHINGLRLDTLESSEDRAVMNAMAMDESSIQSVIDMVNNLNVSAQNVLYLEEARHLHLHLPAVRSLRSIPIGSITRLDAYATDLASFCGLERHDCYCRRQYIVELSPSKNASVHQEATADVTFNFLDPNGLFALKVVSQAVSTSERCSRSSAQVESSKIFWRKFDDYAKASSQKPVAEVDGFVSDAQVFLFEGRIYLILAIFYNKEANSHATNSVVYEFDLKDGKSSRTQLIATDGARAVNVFHVTTVGVHLLIGCVKGKAESLLLRFDPQSRQFQSIRTFATGGSKHIASVGRGDKRFVILNNPDIEALQIFAYDPTFDNFYDYQNLYFNARVTSLDVFYAGDDSDSEAFVVSTTKDGWLYIHEYMFSGKFQLKMSHWMDDIQVISSFRFMNENYLFAGLRSNSTILKVVQQGLK